MPSEAVELGALWCLTGGEPLLRRDFEEIYLGLKRFGLLVSMFTNACLVTPEHVELLRHYPPRDIEVSVYGATRETYEAVTRRPGSYDAFVRGLDMLLDSGLKVRLKAMAMRSNVHELDEISRFCHERTKDYYRFDPLLHLRFDGDPVRNNEIRAERLTPEEVVAVERADEERFDALQKGCADGELIKPEFQHDGCDHLFHCGAGNGELHVGYGRHASDCAAPFGTRERCTTCAVAPCERLGRSGCLACMTCAAPTRSSSRSAASATSSTSVSGVPPMRLLRQAEWTIGWSTSAPSPMLARTRWLESRCRPSG